MIRLFSFIFVLIVIGFASGYAVFAASTVGEHSPQSNADPAQTSDAPSSDGDCTKISDADVKQGTANGDSSDTGGTPTATGAK